MSYSDEELKFSSAIAYKDFSTEIGILTDQGKKPPFSISELCKASGKEVSEVFPGADCDKISKWTIVDYYDNNSETGFYGCLIETEPGKAVIAFRGSEGMDNLDNLQHDWIEADFGLMNSTLTEQQKDAEIFLKQISKSDYIKDYDYLATTGHSLGGNLAMHAVITSSLYGLSDKIQQCVSLDGPGVSSEYIEKYRPYIELEKNKITHYRWSPVGALLNDLPGVERIKLVFKADGVGDLLIMRHELKNLVFDSNGNAIRSDGNNGWYRYDDILHKISQAVDHLPKAIGDRIISVTCRLMYFAVWNYKAMFDKNHNLTLFGEMVVSAAVFFIVTHPLLTIEIVGVLLVALTAFFVGLVVYELVYELIEKIVTKIAEAVASFFKWVGETLEKFKQFIAENLKWLKALCDKLFNKGYQYATRQPCIQINTDKMLEYAAALREVNKKLMDIDLRMDRLYRSLRLWDRAKLMCADVLTGYSNKLGRCAGYLEDTASEFNELEAKLIKIL